MVKAGTISGISTGGALISPGSLVTHNGRIAMVVRVTERGTETDDAYRYLAADILYFLDQPITAYGKYNPRSNQSEVTIPAQRATVNVSELTHVA